jgi:hypothetical protein
MNQSMEIEQSQNFNERLSQWVASQGFWFQVRYSMSGSGVKGRAMFHLLRMATRLLVVALVVALGFWVYLIKRPTSAAFWETFEKNLKNSLSAEQIQIQGLDRVQGQLELNRVAAEGGIETFFSSLEARTIRCRMGLLDGLKGIWKPGLISIARLEIDLRAGADDADAARMLAEAVFRRSERVEISAFEVADATFRWGYSDRTRGAIESSFLRVQRSESGWRLSFKGGYFYQNWLHRFEIVSLVVVCRPEGLVFEKAELKQGAGTVDFSGLKVAGGERPEISGVAKVRKIDLETILPTAVRPFVEGVISSDLRVFGSTNTSEGVGFEGQLVMDEENVVSLRERIHLLQALSVVDFSRTYHRVDFEEGSMQMKTHNGGLELTEIKLKADDLFTMEGAMRVRLPTQEEIDKAVSQGTGFQGSPLFSSEDEVAASVDRARAGSDFSLKRAAQEARRIRDGEQSIDSLSLFDRLGLSLDMRRLQAQASERMSRMLRYEGTLVITLPPDAFERAPRLAALHPVDPRNGRIAMKVPLEGHLWELTLSQAENIYQLGQR